MSPLPNSLLLIKFCSACIVFTNILYTYQNITCTPKYLQLWYSNFKNTEKKAESYPNGHWLSKHQGRWCENKEPIHCRKKSKSQGLEAQGFWIPPFWSWAWGASWGCGSRGDPMDPAEKTWSPLALLEEVPALIKTQSKLPLCNKKHLAVTPQGWEGFRSSSYKTCFMTFCGSLLFTRQGAPQGQRLHLF